MMTTRNLCDLAAAIAKVCADRDRLETELERLRNSQHQTKVDYERHVELQEQYKSSETSLRFARRDLASLQQKHDLVTEKYESLLREFHKLEVRFGLREAS